MHPALRAQPPSASLCVSLVLARVVCQPAGPDMCCCRHHTIARQPWAPPERREDFEGDTSGRRWMEHPTPDMIDSKHEFWGSERKEPHWANQVQAVSIKLASRKH